MIQCLVEEKAPLSAEIASTGKAENLTTNEWKLAEGYITILAPFEQASRELWGESYPTLSMKIPALHGLHKKLQAFISDIANRGSGISLARKLMVSLERRFPSFDEVTKMICTLRLIFFFIRLHSITQSFFEVYLDHRSRMNKLFP